ncbi:MAG: amidohydrolase [Actinobacteria bacterium]|nr:amidohydrolase [Actinomycetota bacterium]
MPLQDHMQLVSTDDHLVEPPTLWTDRLPADLVDQGPRIVEQPGDAGAPAQVWTYNGRLYPQIGLNAVAGKDPEEFGTDPVRYDQMLAGCYDPKARLADMDRDGVQAQLCFPSFPRIAGGVFISGVLNEGDDPELARQCVAAWNDFQLDEWVAVAPDRYIPVVMLPLWDVDASVAEIERTAAKGARTITFPENPVPYGLPSFHTDHWDPVFSAAEEAGMPLCMHFGSSGKAPHTADDAPLAVVITLFGCNSMYAATDLLFSPVFHRHPDLKVALSEGGIGWIPYLLERADYVWNRHRHYQDIEQTTPPSELFKRHIWGCFIDDEAGIRHRHEIGVDRITWECDYPHSDSNFPDSRTRAAEVLADVPDDEVHRMVEWNARELFTFPRSDA